jgi:choline dehydrogenase-like flavoprotein
MSLRMDTEVLVIGSGPGGASVAAMLAEAGKEVLLVEEGAHHAVDSAPSYSLAEMAQKYRYGGLNPALGPTKVTYIEGRCVGGASEINAALYHRPHEATLEDWAARFGIEDLGPKEMEPHFEAVEAAMSVSRRPAGLSPASGVLGSGAEKMGWKHEEVRRFWAYEEQADKSWRGRRQSMTQTLIPRALAAGCRLLTHTRIARLVQGQGQAIDRATGTRNVPGRPAEAVEIRAQHVFVCCGAVQSPALLRRSGFVDQVGNTLRMHPMVRIAARFPFSMNEPHWGVPVRQVEEFKPKMTLGCSHSSPPHLGLWLPGDLPDKADLLEAWDHMGVFYVAVTGEALGTVRSLPGTLDTVVRYGLTPADMSLLGLGLSRLGQLLFAAGATEVFSPVPGQGRIDAPAGLRHFEDGLPQGRVNISAIHLFSTCAMGEDRDRCAVDSHGKLHGADNIWVCDGSVLPDTPGVNPQGTIMAIVRRNVLRWLESHP